MMETGSIFLRAAYFNALVETSSKLVKNGLDKKQVLGVDPSMGSQFIGCIVMAMAETKMKK